VFEIYCLVKLLDLAQKAGYRLTGSRRQTYSVGGRGFTAPADTGMYSHWKKEGATLTLYFHPVLTDTDESARTGIHLYRNSTYAFRHWKRAIITPPIICCGGKERGGRTTWYWTPSTVTRKRCFRS
jgi:hypothetical protein